MLFLEQYIRNAELIVNDSNKYERFPEGLGIVIYSILLGYSDVSIILHSLYWDIWAKLDENLYNYVNSLSDEDRDRDTYIENYVLAKLDENMKNYVNSLREIYPENYTFEQF